MEYKTLLGIIAVALNVVAYIPYGKDMIAGKTKPHIFTRLIWGLGSFIVFAGQQIDGAGAGSWPNLITGVLCLAITVYAYSNDGKKYISKSDWLFLGVAFCSLLLYLTTNDWFLSILLISIGEALSFVPTIRKSRYEPQKETISLYRINGVRFLLMVLATEIYTFVTVGNSIMRLIMNGGFALFLLYRRAIIKKNTA